MMPKERT